MRYRFRGLIRSNGRPVEGHVEAGTEDEACNALSDNGIVTESIRPDPRPLNLTSTPQEAPGQVADDIDSALDSSSMQVPFDTLSERYKGKSVWVIDRDKIRRRVAQVVDRTLAQSHQRAESDAETRERVAEAIQGMFGDNRNIASEASSNNVNLEQQIARLANVVKQAESALASINMAARRASFMAGSGGGGGGGRRRYVRYGRQEEPPNEVLLEIFKSNLDLQRGMEQTHGSSSAGNAAPEPAKSA